MSTTEDFAKEIRILKEERRRESTSNSNDFKIDIAHSVGNFEDSIPLSLEKGGSRLFQHISDVDMTSF